MDLFCINRGTLLDNPSVRTLENPELHSVHCLIDVNQCVTSSFEILMDPPSGSIDQLLYNRGWRLDEESKQKSIELAQNVGSCSTCQENDMNHVQGFRIVMNATITNLNLDDSDVPPTLKVHNMEDTTATFVAGSNSDSDSACMTYFGIQDIVDIAAEADAATANAEAEAELSAASTDGVVDTTVTSSSSSSSSGGSFGTSSSGSTGTSSFFDGVSVNSNSDANGNSSSKRNKLMKMYLAHGTLMMIGWGLLLPMGSIIARFLKHRSKNGLWYKLHRGIQVMGLLVAIIGWIISLTQFNVFGDVGFVSYRHGICGMVVMILGCLQPINAFLRPHTPEVGTKKTTGRIVWEYYHKGSGWLAVLLAIPTIVLGTMSLPVVDDMITFQIAYGVGCWGCLLVLIAYIFYDKKTYVKEVEVEEVAALKEKDNDDGIVVAEQAKPVEIDA